MKNVNEKQMQEQIVADYRTNFKGKTDDAQLEKNIKFLQDDLSSYPATADIISYIVYATLTVQLTNMPSPNTLNGKAGGLFTPGRGLPLGWIVTSDLPGLLQNTTNFYIGSVASYFTVVFFDSNHNSLGSFQGAGPTTVFGTGGGTGTWS
jgi:Rhodococcus equi virulence-associated protein